MRWNTPTTFILVLSAGQAFLYGKQLNKHMFTFQTSSDNNYMKAGKLRLSEPITSHSKKQKKSNHRQWKSDKASVILIWPLYLSNWSLVSPSCHVIDETALSRWSVFKAKQNGWTAFWLARFYLTENLQTPVLEMNIWTWRIVVVRQANMHLDPSQMRQFCYVYIRQIIWNIVKPWHGI